MIFVKVKNLKKVKNFEKKSKILKKIKNFEKNQKFWKNKKFWKKNEKTWKKIFFEFFSEFEFSRHACARAHSHYECARAGAHWPSMRIDRARALLVSAFMLLQLEKLQWVLTMVVKSPLQMLQWLLSLVIKSIATLAMGFVTSDKIYCNICNGLFTTMVKNPLQLFKL